MLVRDFTPVYSSLGRWAGRRVEPRMGRYGDLDIVGLINSVSGAVDKTVGSVIKIVDAAQPDAKTQVVNYTPYVSPGGSMQQPGPQGLPQRKWYEDPLMLGAAGIAVLGLGAVLLSKRGRRMAGFGSYHRRSRPSRRHGRR